ncbi:hypothetical protein AMTR_s00152p00086920 [Amborella trichopoda]|uniref:Uncharacterized protein n=1 Tax=Amborella trichopoda TaxID=13333 RepID=W1PMW3_AMBTC|nr:hypothetical protein AMTR_s00152p00086920 [Amborella trichopoda]
MLSPIGPPVVPSSSGGGFALPPKLEKRMRASPCPIRISEAATTPLQETMIVVAATRPALSSQTSFRLSRQVESTSPPVVEAEATPAERPVDPKVVQPPTLSPLSQGDLFCAITEEGDILVVGIEMIDEATVVTTPEVPGPAISKTETQTFFPSEATLELVAVPSLKALISVIAHVKAAPDPHIPSSEPSVLASPEPTVLVEITPLVVVSSVPSSTSSTASDVKTSIIASLLH